MIKRKYWVLTYSLNDYYGEREQFCCFIKFQKNIAAAIKWDEKHNARGIWSSNKNSEDIDTDLSLIKRTSPSVFELKLGDHLYVAKFIDSFESCLVT